MRRAGGIEAGKIYRTVSGTRAQIYNITETEVHGAVLVNGVWEMHSWLKSGKSKSGKGKNSPNDIILGKPLQIEAGQMYTSRDGRPIKVWEINAGSVDFPIIGAIKDENGYWLPRVWNVKGITKVPFGPNNDIVAEWEGK